jgi:hypothetical protein
VSDRLAAWLLSPHAPVFFFLTATVGALLAAAGLFRLYVRR